MPTAPIYNGPQIAQAQGSAPNLNPNVSPDQMDGGLGQGLANVGRAVSDIYKAERDKADDIAAQDAIARAQNKQTERLYNPQTGVLFRKGADLYENARKYADDFQGDLDEIRDSLGNDRVKMRFQRVRDSLWNEYNRTLSTHVQREIVETANTSTENFLRSTKNRALTALDADPTLALPQKQDGGFDFSEWDYALELMSGSIAENARRTGKAAPEVEKMIQEQEGEFHVQALKLLSQKGNTEAVKAYKERYADKIPYQAKVSVNEAVKHGTVIDESQDWTDRIIGMVTPDPMLPTPEGKAPTLQEQEAAANTLVADLLKGKGEVRDQVQRRIAAEFNQRRRLFEERQKDTSNSYLSRIQKNESYDRLSKETDFQSIDPMQQELIHKFWKQKQGESLGKDEAKVYEYRATALSDNEDTREWFRTLDLTRQGFTPDEFKELVGIQMALQQSHLSEQKKLEYDGIRSIHEIADDAMNSMGWRDNNDEGRRYKYQFQKRLEEEVRAVEARTKKKVVPADVQQIADELILKAAVKGKHFGTDKKFLFELTSAEAAAPDTKIAISSISEETKQRIRTQFQKSQKRLPTDEELQRVYYNEVRTRQQTRGFNFKK